MYEAGVQKKFTYISYLQHLNIHVVCFQTFRESYKHKHTYIVRSTNDLYYTDSIWLSQVYFPGRVWIITVSSTTTCARIRIILWFAIYRLVWWPGGMLRWHVCVHVVLNRLYEVRYRCNIKQNTPNIPSVAKSKTTDFN